MSDISTWRAPEVDEWLNDFVRVPRSHSSRVSANVGSGPSLLQHTVHTLSQLGLPWGLASHVADAIRQLRGFPNGVFAPHFVWESCPYPWPYNGDLRAANTALVMIDMQKDFVGYEGYVARMYGKDAVEKLRAPIEPLKRLLAMARGVGLRVIHTREGHNASMTDLPANKRWRSEGVAGGIGSPEAQYVLTKGSENFDIIPELYPIVGVEDVVDKPGKGSFFSTNLELLLKAQGIQNLILGGVTTDVCVHTTMREANDRGYECLLLEDGSAAVDDLVKAQIIRCTHKQGGVFGATATVAHVMDALAKLAK